MKISELTLFTTNLEAQKHFYTQVLELPLVASDAEKFTVKMGVSSLSFVKSERIHPAHFAINISSYKIQQALQWIQKRTNILLCEGEAIADFSNWNAEALYFYDKDGNIVEFIARKDLDIINTHLFSTADILNISEIAIVSTDNEAIYHQLYEMRPIEVYDGNFERFCALGNAEGLFILVNNTKKKWYPTSEEAYPADFYIKGDYNFAFINGAIITEKV
ncbi:VOC family protein [Kordia sp.]|uniref:VOC family protein n=1 Tax=Kordia sp. TaxID=1965332 RepID=UPI0025C174E7|nr:VOC family protein [Kordia sp.]MCH2194412.1 VOC family protein [Kordia sp.]